VTGYAAVNPNDAEQTPVMRALRSEWLFSLYLDIGFDQLQNIGAAPIGWRGIYPVYGGRFEGPRLRGEVLPNGADSVTRRADGVTLLDVRLGLLTHDGATIAMSYTGMFRLAAAAQRYRQGEPVAYAESYIRTTPRFETGDPRYVWLNDIIGVANGGPPGASPTYEVFAIL
jgi:hypothetical protein